MHPWPSMKKGRSKADRQKKPCAAQFMFDALQKYPKIVVLEIDFTPDLAELWFRDFKINMFIILNNPKTK